MITKFKIFEGKWSYINSNFEDEDTHEIYIDDYVGNNDEGQVLAKVNIITGEIIYEDEWAKKDKRVQNEIAYLLADVVPVRRNEIEQEKYNL
jgi:hypothetical protein